MAKGTQRMSSMMSPSWPWAAAAGVPVGYLLGLAYFYHLRRCAERFTRQVSPLRIVATSVVRMLSALAVFFVLIQWSAAAALFGLVGFTIARRLMIAKTEPG